MCCFLLFFDFVKLFLPTDDLFPSLPCCLLFFCFHTSLLVCFLFTATFACLQAFLLQRTCLFVSLGQLKRRCEYAWVSSKTGEKGMRVCTIFACILFYSVCCCLLMMLFVGVVVDDDVGSYYCCCCCCFQLFVCTCLLFIFLLFLNLRLLR